MSGLRVNNLRGVAGSAPTFPDGVVVTGVATATTFDGNLTGNVTGNVVGNVTGDVTGNITGTTGSFSGNVSIGNTLTYNDVTNIDSVGVVTARSGIKIGAGQSVGAVSGVTTYYGDGSQLTGIEFGVHNFVASGTLSNGQTVIIQSDGTVTGITTVAPGAGTSTIIEYALGYIGAVYDSANEKVVIAYRGSSNHGKCAVGTVDATNNTISFGTPVTFESAEILYLNASYDVNAGKVVIAYMDRDNNDIGTAIVGTVSGNSISFGSPSTFDSGVDAADIKMVYDTSSQKNVIVYTDFANQKGKAVVATVSGTSVSFGTPAVFNNGKTNMVDITCDQNAGKVVVVYRDFGDSNKGKAIVGNVSGTNISFGSEEIINNNNGYYYAVGYDSDSQKVIVAFSDIGNNNRGTAMVGTVSGTSISFGSEVVYDSSATDFNNVVYDASAQKILIYYRGSSYYPKCVIGTVSGTSISFGNIITVHPAYSSGFYAGGAVYDSSAEKPVFFYVDHPDLFARVFKTTPGTTLTSKNYIGIAAEAIADGATGKVTIFGGTNSGQTGLTTSQTYYVQNDGSLGTSAGNPSVVAGTSISSTKIIVKG